MIAIPAALTSSLDSMKEQAKDLTLTAGSACDLMGTLGATVGGDAIHLAKDAEARFAGWLLRHAEPGDAEGSLAVILRDRKRLIAAQLGIAPETFSRVLKHLRDRKLISGGGRVLNLLDLSGLQSLAGI